MTTQEVIKVYSEETVGTPKPGALVDSIRNKYQVDLSLTEKPDVILLHKIIVPAEDRDRGIGTKVLQEICAYADRTGKTIGLTPANDFGISVSRLEHWYKSLGFVPNKGKSRDFRFMESMRRDPK